VENSSWPVLQVFQVLLTLRARKGVYMGPESGQQRGSLLCMGSISATEMQSFPYPFSFDSPASLQSQADFWIQSASLPRFSDLQKTFSKASALLLCHFKKGLLNK